MEFSGSVKAIINQIGGVYGVIAHSFGGASTVYALANLQQTQKLERLVLIASPSNLISAMDKFLRLLRVPQGVENHFFKLVKGKIQQPLDHTERMLVFLLLHLVALVVGLTAERRGAVVVAL